MRLTHLISIITLTTLAACGGTPGPGDSGYAYNVDGTYSGAVTVEGQAFSGSVDLTTTPGGVVTGTFTVTQPIQMSGDVEGTLMNDRLTVRMTYVDNPLTGCSAGSMTGTLTVTEGGAGLSGPVTVDDCGQTLGASVSYTR